MSKKSQIEEMLQVRGYTHPMLDNRPIKSVWEKDNLSVSFYAGYITVKGYCFWEQDTVGNAVIRDESIVINDVEIFL